MPRKFALTMASMAAVAFGLTGLALAAEDSPLEKNMTAIQAKTNAIRKATRTPQAWKKDQKTVADNAEAIAKLAKDSRDEKGPAEKQKKSHDDWKKLMDDMVKASDEIAVLARKTDATQAQAKDAFTGLNKTCTACHSVFRVDDEK